jgi:hypothetical protein
MPRKNRQLALRNAAPGSNGARPTTNQDGTSGKPTKPLPSASVSMFIRRISVQLSLPVPGATNQLQPNLFRNTTAIYPHADFVR